MLERYYRQFRHHPHSVPGVAGDAATVARRQIFARNLRKARLDAGLTQEVVALAAGLDRSFYVQVENGKHSILTDRVFAIAEALQVPTAALFVDL